MAIGGCSTGISDRYLAHIGAADAEALVRSGDGSLFGTGGDAVLVDPRTNWKYQAGHVSGAVSLPMERLHDQLWILDEFKTVIIYGETWNDALAIAMSKELMKRGVKDVRTLRGGIEGWTDAGFSVVVGSEPR